MFIHWGLYAIPARGEWVRSVERIPKEAYMTYFEEFDPVDYDPKQWAKAAKEAGNDRARLALDLFTYACKKYVGAYMAVMGGLDCIVFTAGVGENTPTIRSAVAGGLEFFGVKLDEARNNYKNDGQIHEISAADSRVKVLVIPTNEELVIARETAALL